MLSAHFMKISKPLPEKIFYKVYVEDEYPNLLFGSICIFGEKKPDAVRTAPLEGSDEP